MLQHDLLVRSEASLFGTLQDDLLVRSEAVA